jgi:hypothetical protein
MKRFLSMVGAAVCLFVAASLVGAYMQTSPVEVARRHAVERVVAGESLLLLGYQSSANLIGRKETVRFQVQGAKPPKKLAVELQQPVYFLPWQVMDVREEPD